MSERTLRLAAVAIAIVALLDPVLTLSSPARRRVSVVVQGGPSMDLPAADGNGSRRARAETTRRSLGEALGGGFVLVDGADATADAMVVIGDRYPEEPIPRDLRVSTISLNAPIEPNVSIAHLDAPPSIPPSTAIPVGVTVRGSGVRGSTSVLVVRAGGAEVGRASHAWSADDETWRAEVGLVPIGQPPFDFDVAIEALPSERTASDNRASLRVGLAPPMRVLVFEARPSWVAAFVRRSMESDPRFVVSGLTRAAPRAMVRSAGAPDLPDGPAGLARPDAFDLVLVGGIDALQPSSLAALDRFMRERGGAVAILPDARIPPPAANSLIAGIALREALLDRAAPLETGALPRVDASELLEADSLPPGAEVLARAPASHRPVVWSVARGDGRLLVSGAMDAWRYRGEPSVEFDRFWRSVLSGLALGALPPVAVTLAPSRAGPGEPVTAAVRVRALERGDLGDRLAIAGSVNGHPLRLWPDARPGMFVGSFPATPGSDAIVTASLGDGLSTGSARLTIDGHAREAVGVPLALLSRTHAGIDVAPAGLATLAGHLRETLPAESEHAARRPMRSAWWFVAFSACLSLEWWLRRRRGAR